MSTRNQDRAVIRAVTEASEHASFVVSSIDQLGALFSAISDIADTADDQKTKHLAQIGLYLIEDWGDMCRVGEKNLSDLLESLGGES